MPKHILLPMNPILPPFSHSCLTLLSIMLPFNRSWIHQLDRGRVTVRRSSGTITPYLVAQRCRATLKGGTYGDFSSPESTATNSPVSRTRRFTHETTSEGHSVSRSRLFTHETAAKDTRGNRGAFSASYGNSMETLRALLDAAEVRPEPVRLIERLGAFRDGNLDG